MLDEATSALDSEVELAIQGSSRPDGGKTVIAIAHRLSTIARMDRLIVLEQGRIVEQGSHDELLRRKGHYERLWRHQSGGFLGHEVVTPETATEPVNEHEPEENISSRWPNPAPTMRRSRLARDNAAACNGA